MKTRDQDSIQDIFIANTLSMLLVFTTQGQMFKVPVYEIPETTRGSRGIPIVNLVRLENDDKIAAVLNWRLG